MKTLSYLPPIMILSLLTLACILLSQSLSGTTPQTRRGVAGIAAERQEIPKLEDRLDAIALTAQNPYRSR